MPGVGTYMRACVRACVRARVRAGVHACVRVRACPCLSVACAHRAPLIVPAPTCRSAASHMGMALVEMAYIVMAYIVIVYIVMVYIVMAYIVMAYRGIWLCRDGIYVYGRA